MKRTVKLIIAAVCVLLIPVVWMIYLGNVPQTSAYISDEFTVSEDSTSITFRTGVGSSMGFIRAYRDSHHDGVHDLTFLSAWGGMNSSLGAKSEYTLKLSPEDTEIRVYHGQKGFETALTKDPETGEWHR